MKVFNTPNIIAFAMALIAGLALLFGQGILVQKKDLPSENKTIENTISGEAKIQGDVNIENTIGVDEDHIDSKFNELKKQNEQNLLNQRVNQLIEEGKAQRKINGFVSERPFYLEAMELDPDNEEIKKFYETRKAEFLSKTLSLLEKCRQAPTMMGRLYLSRLEEVFPEHKMVAEFSGLIEDYEEAERLANESLKITSDLYTKTKFFLPFADQRSQYSSLVDHVIELEEQFESRAGTFQILLNSAKDRIKMLPTFNDAQALRKQALQESYLEALNRIDAEMPGTQ